MSEQIQTISGEPEPLLVRHEAPLGWLVLNRPQVRNALNLRTWQLIVKGVAELNDDPDVRVIIMGVIAVCRCRRCHVQILLCRPSMSPAAQSPLSR